MGDAHVDLFALEVDNGVLAPVLKEVLIGGDTVVGQDSGETVSATSVHQVSQKLKHFKIKILNLKTILDSVIPYLKQACCTMFNFLSHSHNFSAKYCHPPNNVTFCFWLDF